MFSERQAQNEDQQLDEIEHEIDALAEFGVDVTQAERDNFVFSIPSEQLRHKFLTLDQESRDMITIFDLLDEYHKDRLVRYVDKVLTEKRTQKNDPRFRGTVGVVEIKQIIDWWHEFAPLEDKRMAA